MRPFVPENLKWLSLSRSISQKHIAYPFTLQLYLKKTKTSLYPFNYLLTTPNHKEWKDIIIKHLKEFKKIVLMIQKL